MKTLSKSTAILLSVFLAALLLPNAWGQTPANSPFESVSALYVFPSYQTCEAFTAATAKPCPDWDKTKTTKNWFDPAPVVAFQDQNGVDLTIYNRVLSGKPDPNGKPGTRQLVIAVADAARVNIPPTGALGTYTTATPEGAAVVAVLSLPAIPFPLKADSATQALAYSTMPGNIPVTRNLDVPLSQDAANQDELMRLVKAIAAKLGVQ